MTDFITIFQIEITFSYKSIHNTLIDETIIIKELKIKTKFYICNKNQR